MEQTHAWNVEGRKVLGKHVPPAPDKKGNIKRAPTLIPSVSERSGGKKVGRGVLQKWEKKKAKGGGRVRPRNKKKKKKKREGFAGGPSDNLCGREWAVGPRKTA